MEILLNHASPIAPFCHLFACCIQAFVLSAPAKSHFPRARARHGALRVQLSASDLARIEEIAPHGAAAGQRYPEHRMTLINK